MEVGGYSICIFNLKFLEARKSEPSHLDLQCLPQRRTCFDRHQVIISWAALPQDRFFFVVVAAAAAPVIVVVVVVFQMSLFSYRTQLAVLTRLQDHGDLRDGEA